MLYVKVHKAIYECLKSSLLFYKELSSDLIRIGFILNIYDRFVVNKMVKRKQMTIVWHVDNLKISYNNSKEVTRIIQRIEQLYGEVRVTRRKVHDYLGMILDFSNPGKLKMKINDYTAE